MPAQNQDVLAPTTTMDIMDITSTANIITSIMNIIMNIMSMAAPAGTLTTAAAAVTTMEQNTLAKSW